MNIFEESYLEDLSKNDFEMLSKNKYLVDKNLKVEEVKHGIILPPEKYKVKIANKLGFNIPLHGKGGVINSDGTYVELSSQDAYGMRQRVSGAYKINSEKVRFIDEEVIYMNYYIHQWGHFLLDVIGRLWYVLKSDKNLKIAYTCYKNEEDKILGNYLEFIKLLGIEESRLVMINEVTQFSKVIVPESSILPGKYYTKEYKNLFDEVVKNSNFNVSKAGKIYCSRSKLKIAKNKEIGENRIEEIFIKNGYRPIYMEQHSLSEQIEILNNSEEIVLTSGSLAHNLLFLKNKTKVTILNKTYRVNLHQFMINDLSEGLIKFVDIYIAPMPILYGLGPFLMSVTKPFKKYLKDEKIGLENEKLLSNKEYLNYYLKWIWLYKAYIFRINSISEGKNDYEKSFKQIRNYYKTGRINE